MVKKIWMQLISLSTKKVVKYFFIFFVCFYLIKLVFTFTLVTQLLSLIPYNPQYGKNILVVGVDEVDGTKRSDSIVVIHINPNDREVRALSIPRDTRVAIDKVGVSKINHAYAYGKIKLLKKTISEFLSIPIHNYAVISSSGVEKIIDEVGGVTLEIEENMVYDDYASGLHINFSKGEQYLNGEDLIKFLRFRNNSQGDIGRITRQQDVFKILFEKVFKFRTLVMSPKVIGLFLSSIKTDLSIIDINQYLKLFLNSKEYNNIEFYTVPGSIRLIDGVSYWRPDIVYLDNLISKTFVDYKNIKQSDDAKAFITSKQISRVSQQIEIDKEQELGESVRLSVEVLNGNGYKGVAKNAANFLTENGLLVKNVGNSHSFNYENTLIVDWKGNVENSMKLATLLKVKPENIIIYNRQDKPLDITLVLGKDWTLGYLKGLAKK